jgi:hypothetical protein
MEHSQSSVTLQESANNQPQCTNANEMNSRLPAKHTPTGHIINTATSGIKRKREAIPDMNSPTSQMNSQVSLSPTTDSEDKVIELLQRSLDSIQSLQETLKSQGEALIGLLTELVHKS